MAEHGREQDPVALPSWDEERVRAPERPAFVSNLPEERFLPRPRRVIVACILVLIATVGVLGATAFAALQIDQIREALIDAMPADVIEDYADDDTALAANVMLGAAGGLLLLASLAQCLSIVTLTLQRRAAARVLFVVFAILGAPISMLSAIVREAGTVDLALIAALALCVLAAVGLVCTPAVTRWVRQREPRRTIPLAQVAGVSPLAQPPS